MTAMKVAASENSAMRRDQMASREIDVSVNSCRRIEGPSSLRKNQEIEPLFCPVRLGDCQSDISRDLKYGG
jgi:hypothetical protein